MTSRPLNPRPDLPCWLRVRREPLYACAERACWWELAGLAVHVHPSVAAMARSLLRGSPVVYDGDPLKDHSLATFLDKFVQKKPKVRPVVMAGGGAAVCA